MKSKKLIFILFTVAVAITTNAQIKIWPSGYVGVGYTATAPTSGFVAQISGKTLFTSGTATVSSGGAQITGTNTASAAGAPDYTWNGDATTGIFHPTSSAVAFSIAGSEKMRLNATGLGIGTTPSNYLDVRKSGSGNEDYFARFYKTGLTTGQVVDIGVGYGDGTTGLLGYYYSSTSADRGVFVVNAGDAASSGVFVRQGGNVGVGTLTPSYLLDISGGDMNVSTLTKGYRLGGNYVIWQNNVSSSLYLGSGAGSATATPTGSNNLAVGYNSLKQMTSGTGNTAIGPVTGTVLTTGTNNTAIGYLSTVNSGTFTNTTALGYSALATASNYVVLGNTSVSTISGQVNYTTFSDSRVKNNIQENVIGLAFIKKLRPVTYNYDVDKENQILGVMPDSNDPAPAGKYDIQQKTFTGFLAQEVEQAATAVNFDFSGVDKPQNTNCLYGLRYSEFVVPLVKAVQELSKTTDSLVAVTHKQDSTINALQNQVNESTGGKKAADDQAAAIKSLQDQINNCCLKANSNGGNSTGAMLYQNIPNPFNQSTNIKCFIPDESKSASLLVFDMNGTLKKTVPLNGKGEINTTINGKELVAGMYYYTLIIDGNEIDTKKMILTEQ